MESKTYYENVAKNISFQTCSYINGEFIKGAGGMYKSINPANGQVITEIYTNTVEEVYEAEKAARKAFESGVWSKADPQTRKEVLLKLADLIEENGEELAVIETLDSGKPINDTINGDVTEMVECFRFHAEAIDKINDNVTAGDSGHLSIVVREPLGVVAAIVPWNFPMLMAAWKIAPILASGNSLIIKPASTTQLSLLKLCELFEEAGIPKGVINVVTGGGRLIGNALAEHPYIEGITFTGSTEVGKSLLEKSGNSNAKRVFLEMGGKNPGIVMPDVKDLDHVAAEAVNAVFWNMGENCTSNSRLIVHESIHDKLVEKIVEKTNAIKTGDPMDPENDLGALVETSHMEKVLNYIETGKNEGGKLIAGGVRLFEESGGNFISPTVFDNVKRDMTIWNEEIFGPVLAITTFKDENEALEIANDTEYGLQGSIYTDDLSTAHRMSRRLNVGTVSINCYSEGNIGTPFGGFKQSGFMSRDNSIWANMQFTELKTIWIKV